MTTVAAYIRVSSRSQNHAYQRREIERVAAARGEEIDRWYAERESAARLNRPELDRLRQHAREGRIATIYVWRLDRLSRSGIRDTLGLLEEFRTNGARLASVADGFALDGTVGEIVIAVLAWAAQLERQKISENLSSARRRVEASGGSWGRPRRVPPRLAEKIRALHGDKSIREIAIALKVPRSTVHQVLSEKGAYSTRRVPAKKQRRKIAHPPASG